MPEPNLGRELPEPDPSVRPPTRLAGVLIDDQHRPGGPAQFHGAPRERVLTCR
jgi:hypothetical protein